MVGSPEPDRSKVVMIFNKMSSRFGGVGVASQTLSRKKAIIVEKILTIAA
jgi:hypothetical protein